MSDKQTLSITCNISTKNATLSGQVAIRETVTVYVTSFGGTVASSLRLGICKKGELFAVCNTFTTGATIFTGELDLNTEELVDIFGNRGGNETMSFELALWDVLNDRLLVNTTISIMNNPYSEGMADPTPVDHIAGAGAEDFTSAEKTKLAGIETLADVTDATNVDASGAVMETDYTAGTMLYATSNATPQPKTVSEMKVILGITDLSTALLDADFPSTGLMKTDGAGTYSVITDNSTNWNSAYTNSTKFKVSSADPSADYLDGKINTTNFEIASYALRLKDGGISSNHLNLTSITAEVFSDGASKVMMLATERSKLAGIEAGAGAISTANVEATGAVMDSDFDANGMLIRTASGVYGVIAYPLLIAHGGTNSTTALSNGRIMKSLGGSIVEAAAITASRALISDANGIPTHSVTTSTELSYVNGVTSAIQTQMNTKLAKLSAEDLEFTLNTKGIITIDRTTGTKYRWFIDSGIPQLEVVT